MVEEGGGVIHNYMYVLHVSFCHLFDCNCHFLDKTEE